MPKILVTGASGVGGSVVCNYLKDAGYTVRMADMAPPPEASAGAGEFVRCDTRTSDDVRRAVEGMDAVVHIAAWHCGHNPPVSDATIWSVNIGGTFNVFKACQDAGVRAVVYASSMAYGWGNWYSVSKVAGEEMCRGLHEMTGAAVSVLRYHCFVPCPYLEYGARMLRNGVDTRDIGSGTLAAVRAALDGRVGLFNTIVHSDHGMPRAVIEDFRANGPDWCEAQVPGGKALLEKYGLWLPEGVEQHDLSAAEKELGWTPDINFVTFLKDLKTRDARGEDVRNIWSLGALPDDWSAE